MRLWTYYLIWSLLMYGLQTPWLWIGLALFLVFRRLIPEPGALFRALGRMRRLKQRAEVNVADVTARRDLAVLYLDVLRPRAALARVDEALARAPDDAELRFLRGLALHKSGKHEEALLELVRAVDLDGRVRFGQPYLVAGDAMMALRRWDGAVDAYERCIDHNSSDVAAHTRLARAFSRAGDRAAATRTLLEGVRTWHVLPRGMKRRAFGSYLEAQWARAWLLRQPTALAIAAALLLAGAFVANAALQFWAGGRLRPLSEEPSEHGCVELSTSESMRSVARIERDAYGRVVRLEMSHDELADSPAYVSLRREFKAGGRVSETWLEAREESAESQREHRLDDRGRLLETDEEGTRTSYRYEGDKLVQVDYPATGHFTTYRHVPAQRRIETWVRERDQPEVLAEVYELDEAGRLAVWRRLTPGKGEHSIRYVRDAHGVVTEQVERADGFASRTRCKLDAQHRPMQCTWDDQSDGTVDSRTVYSYGALYGAHPCEDDTIQQRVVEP